MMLMTRTRNIDLSPNRAFRADSRWRAQRSRAIRIARGRGRRQPVRSPPQSWRLLSRADATPCGAFPFFHGLGGTGVSHALLGEHRDAATSRPPPAFPQCGCFACIKLQPPEGRAHRDQPGSLKSARQGLIAQHLGVPSRPLHAILRTTQLARVRRGRRIPDLGCGCHFVLLIRLTQPLRVAEFRVSVLGEVRTSAAINIELCTSRPSPAASSSTHHAG